MAINFEAANMAGYNNPKIEVFRVVLNDSAEIVSAPKKSEIINCIQRGSLPFLVMESTEQSYWLLPISSGLTQSSGAEELSFSIVTTDATGAYSAVSIFYPESDGTPPTLASKPLQ